MVKMNCYEKVLLLKEMEGSNLYSKMAKKYQAKLNE